MKRLFGLIGYPLAHSFSQSYFSDKFDKEGITDVEYRNFELADIDKLPKILGDNPNLFGLNVTMPHKKRVIAYLDDIESDAKEIGAVNCIRITDGRLKGYNTDADGFRNALFQLLDGYIPEKALLLGSGGASQAIEFVLKSLDVEVTKVSRRAQKGVVGYDEITTETIANHSLIINTTPLGTHPNTGSSPPIPYHALTSAHFLFDVVYNPPLTLFLKQGQDRGAKTMNGYKMLVEQAERSWQIWNQAYA